MKIGRKALAVASIVLATASAVIAQEDKWDFEVAPEWHFHKQQLIDR